MIIVYFQWIHYHDVLLRLIWHYFMLYLDMRCIIYSQYFSTWDLWHFIDYSYVLTLYFIYAMWNYMLRIYECIGCKGMIFLHSFQWDRECHDSPSSTCMLCFLYCIYACVVRWCRILQVEVPGRYRVSSPPGFTGLSVPYIVWWKWRR